MSAGIARFDRWLEDQLAFGLAALEADPRGRLEPMAARLTDDQLPNAASALRGYLPRVGVEADWATRLGEELGYWHLLNRMALQPERLDADAFAGLAFAYGYRLSRAKLENLGRGVPDRWTCVGIVEGNDQQLFYRRTHWRGTTPGHALTHNTYQYGGALPPTQLEIGAWADLAMLAYPGPLPGRAVLPEGASLRSAVGGIAPEPPHHFGSWRAQAAWHRSLARRQPWRRAFPVAVGPLRMEVGKGRGGAYLASLVDGEARAVRLPLRGAAPGHEARAAAALGLVAVVGAEPFVLYGSRSRDAVTVWSAWQGGRLTFRPDVVAP